MKTLVKTIVICVLGFVSLKTNAQGFDAFLYEKEQAIAKDFQKISEVQDDYVREKANERIIENFQAALNKENSMDYEFASLKISKLRSKDDRVRIITWNVPQEDGTHKYFGFVQFHNGENYLATRLNDASDEILQPERQRLQPEQWYGAVYYDIIDTRYKGRTYYTLLGWDGHSYLMTQKIIDVVAFKSNGKPMFGKNVFKFNRKTAKRIILRYSSQANVTLRYQKRKKRIVFDHLAPIKPQFAGQFEYYGPDMYHDALVLKKGKWWLDTIVDVQNEKREPVEREMRYSSY